MNDLSFPELSADCSSQKVTVTFEHSQAGGRISLRENGSSIEVEFINIDETEQMSSIYTARANFVDGNQVPVAEYKIKQYFKPSSLGIDSFIVEFTSYIYSRDTLLIVGGTSGTGNSQAKKTIDISWITDNKIDGFRANDGYIHRSYRQNLSTKDRTELLHN